MGPYPEIGLDALTLRTHTGPSARRSPSKYSHIPRAMVISFRMTCLNLSCNANRNGHFRWCPQNYVISKWPRICWKRRRRDFRCSFWGPASYWSLHSAVLFLSLDPMNTLKISGYNSPDLPTFAKRGKKTCPVKYCNQKKTLYICLTKETLLLTTVCGLTNRPDSCGSSTEHVIKVYHFNLTPSRYLSCILHGATQRSFKFQVFFFFYFTRVQCIYKYIWATYVHY